MEPLWDHLCAGIGSGVSGVYGCRLRRQGYDRRSLSGIAVTLRGTSVSRVSKTQHVVSLSTSEAEYIAAKGGAKEAMIVRAVLSFIARRRVG